MRVSSAIVIAIFAILFLSCSEDKEDVIKEVAYYSDGTDNGYAYVDLGLSVRWATCNVGADKPIDCGCYYAWGETSHKSDYNWSTYKYGTDRDKLTKYCNDAAYGSEGFTDDLVVLVPSDDVAKAMMGGRWRMPTYGELQELKGGCFWQWSDDYKGTGVGGFIVYKAKADADKGKVKCEDSNPALEAVYSIDDAHIFLPAAGFRIDGRLTDLEYSGNYASSSMHLDKPFSAWCLNFSSSALELLYCYRYYGQSVRAVCPVE